MLLGKQNKLPNFFSAEPAIAPWAAEGELQKQLSGMQQWRATGAARNSGGLKDKENSDIRIARTVALQDLKSRGVKLQWICSSAVFFLILIQFYVCEFVFYLIENEEGQCKPNTKFGSWKIGYKWISIAPTSPIGKFMNILWWTRSLVKKAKKLWLFFSFQYGRWFIFSLEFGYSGWPNIQLFAMC